MNFNQISTLVDIDRVSYDRVFQYFELLVKWQKSINLIANSVGHEIWERHIVDGLQLLNYKKSFASDAIMVDMGSGGGIPGLLLGLCLNNEVILQESDQRKCVFLQTVSRETSRSNIKVSVGRIEDTLIHNAGIIFARALAPLDLLLSRSFKQLSAGGECYFHKGERHLEEIEAARENWHFTVDIHPSITNEKAAILHITQLEPRT